MRLLALPAALTLMLLAAPASQAAWGPPIPLSPATELSSAAGLAVGDDDRPVVLLNNYRVHGAKLTLRRIGKGDRPGKPVTVATSNNGIIGEGLFAGRRGDLVAGWLEIINGSRRPVVATGPRLEDRQVLAPGPRSTQFMDIAANRRGDAVVAFWRYSATNEYSVYTAYRHAGGRFGDAQLLASGTPGDPAVAIDEKGAAAVAWAEKPGVTVAQRPVGAVAFGAPVKIASPAQANGDVGVATEDGRVIVSWVTVPRGGPNTVLVAERASATAPFPAPEQISADAITAPRQAPAVDLHGGRVLVAWTQRTEGVDRAVLAIRPRGGAWEAPTVRGAGATVRRLGLLAPAGSRPGLLWMGTDHRGIQTATIRSDDTLAPSRRISLNGGYPIALLAQGRSHSWLAAGRNTGRNTHVPRPQAVLYRST